MKPTDEQIRAEARKRWLESFGEFSITDFTEGANFVLSQDSTIEKVKELRKELQRILGNTESKWLIEAYEEVVERLNEIIKS